MFGFLKNLFKKKAAAAQPVQQEMPPIDSAQPVVEEKPKPSLDRKQKTCGNCGAPNDDFGSTCWLCKKPV